MLKLAIAALAGVTLAVVALPPQNSEGGRDGFTNYSTELGAVIPFGTGIKVLPDPANIWHWTDIITASADTLVEQDVMIDFDGDGIMDTHKPQFRIMVTDVQMVGFRLLAGRALVQLRDGEGNVLWDLSPTPTAQTTANAITGYDAIGHYEKTFATPLVLPLGSKLTIRLAPLSRFAGVRVSLVGRIANL